jgi:hypothetical protein
VFEFRPFNARRVEIVRGDETHAFEKRAGEDAADTWHRVAPEAETSTARRSRR